MVRVKKGKLRAGFRFGPFDFIAYLVIGLLCVITILPFLNIFSISTSAYQYVALNKAMILPKGFNFKAYAIIKSPMLYNSFIITIFYVVVTTVLHIIITLLTAFPLSRKYLPGRKYFLLYITFTMLFGGGLIPYYKIVDGMGFTDTIWVFLVPGLVGAFNIILMKNFLLQIPASLEEAARMDGAGFFRILWQIYFPLSMPIIATLALFFGVGKWNDYFTGIIFVNQNTGILPLQNILRTLTTTADFGTIGSGIVIADPKLTQSIKMAVIIIATLPIMLVYPFLQKYFVKGVLLGSIKE